MPRLQPNEPEVDPKLAAAIADQQKCHQESEDRNIHPSIRGRSEALEARIKKLEKEVL